MANLLEKADLVDESVDAAGMAPSEVDGLDPDPVPGKRTRRRPRQPKTAPAGRTGSTGPTRQRRSGGRFASRDQIRTGIQDEINMYTKMLALTWSMSDPECGEALNAASSDIARDLANLCTRSEWIMENFATTSLIGDIARLLHSALPVLRAVYTHHMGAGRRGVEPEGDVSGDGYPAYQPYVPFRAV